MASGEDVWANGTRHGHHLRQSRGVTDLSREKAQVQAFTCGRISRRKVGTGGSRAGEERFLDWSPDGRL